MEKFIGEANVARDNDSHQNEDREGKLSLTQDAKFEGNPRTLCLDFDHGKISRHLLI